MAYYMWSGRHDRLAALPIPRRLRHLSVALVEPPHTPPQLVDGLPGCGLDAADPLVGDELGRMVTWRGSGDLSALAGREVSVRLHLKRAQVFCLSL